MQALSEVRPLDFITRLPEWGNDHALQINGPTRRSHFRSEISRCLRANNMQGGTHELFQQYSALSGIEQQCAGWLFQAAPSFQPADDSLPGPLQEIWAGTEDARRELQDLPKPRLVRYQGASAACFCSDPFRHVWQFRASRRRNPRSPGVILCLQLPLICGALNLLIAWGKHIYAARLWLSSKIAKASMLWGLAMSEEIDVGSQGLQQRTIPGDLQGALAVCRPAVQQSVLGKHKREQ